ncbi:telomerase Cajal body protein 1 homolog [Toxorhynchites rutilus septentrionalis]|uniref:telomerase Cajal body protein 1 homolog n=1 Tax=Toxorhynchites rutilus septentrionalis TaxID=329112 RepID=UPI002479574B|nr:telomerase Cajal body protein 1 homolog [Toxorhynchites rutilus septentrionalis]
MPNNEAAVVEPSDIISARNNVDSSSTKRSREGSLEPAVQIKAAKLENGTDVDGEAVTTDLKVPIPADRGKKNYLVPDQLEKAMEVNILKEIDGETQIEPDSLEEAALLEEPVVEIPKIKTMDSESLKADEHNAESHDQYDATEMQEGNVNNNSVDEMDVEETEHDTDVTSPKNFEQSHFHSSSVNEIARCSWDRGVNQNYVRGCLWSPDGSCVLTTINNDGMHVFELPSDMYAAQQVTQQRPVNLLESAVHVRESTLVYDYKWYPGMHSSMPETSVWIASRQHEPIQMWDAYTGKLRCSYKGYNVVDEVESALSLAWSTDCSRIYGGYRKSIKMFDVDTPGREISSFPTKVTASCMTPCIPLPNLMMFGSWSRTITALVTNSGQTIAVGNNSRECSHTSGVTWLKFIPRTNLFLSGGRKDPKLLMWDIRSLHKPYHVLERTCDTNQRVYFDSSPHGEWVVTGNTDGNFRVWNLLEIDAASKSYRQYNFPLHRDCCNGVSFHPSIPIVATASGQFHATDDSAESLEQENALTLWWVGKMAISEE